MTLPDQHDVNLSFDCFGLATRQKDIECRSTDQPIAPISCLWPTRAAVYSILGSQHDRFEPQVQPVDIMSRDITRLLRSRYVWFWVRRHSGRGAIILIALLAAAADAAPAENRDIVLPELPGEGSDAGH